jgi:hypothetical protein
MSTERIIIAPAEGSEWPLSLADFADRLRERIPDAYTTRQQLPGRNGDPYYTFQFDQLDNRLYGAYFERHNLSLSEGTIEEWADTIAWFLRLLPESTPTVCLLEAVPIPTPLPSRSTPEQVAAILHELNERF